VGSIGLTSFIVDIAGALVSPLMSTPRAELPRGRTMIVVSRIRLSGEEVDATWEFELTCSMTEPKSVGKKKKRRKEQKVETRNSNTSERSDKKGRSKINFFPRG
jgi:hypothetical protein